MLFSPLAVAFHALSISLALFAFPLHALAVLFSFFAFPLRATSISFLALPVHALAVSFFTLPVHALAVLCFTLPIHAGAVLFLPLALAILLVLPSAASVVVITVSQGWQGGSHTKQEDRGCHQVLHGGLLGCLIYGRGRGRFNSISARFLDAACVHRALVWGRLPRF
jgi:hypothetical protein